MRITRLKLVNNIGVFNGTNGLSEIELDLSKGKHSVTMFIGANGSGKTSIVNTLHMYADSYDTLIPKRDGLKEIDVVYDNYLYKVSHHYFAKGSSFTKKSYITRIDIDGSEIELNPNGNHDSFIEAIESEFLMDPNFMALSALSMGGNSIVNMKAAERKRIINQMLNDTDVYENMYKVVSKKFTEIGNLLKNVSYKISTLKDMTTLDISLSKAEEKLSDINTERDNLLSSINQVRGLINSIDPDSSIRTKWQRLDADKNILEKENLDVIRRIDSIMGTLLNMSDTEFNFKTSNEVNHYVTMMHSALKDINSNLESITEEITIAFAESQSLLISIQEQLVKRSEVHLTRDYKELKQLIAYYEEQVNIYTVAFDGYNPKYTADTLLIGYDILESIKESISALRANYSPSLLASVEELLLYNQSSVTSIGSEINSLNEELDAIEDMKIHAMDGVASEESIREKSVLLAQRPSTCKDNTCPFIKDALMWKSQLEQTESKLREVSDYTTQITSLSKKRNTLKEQLDAIRDIEQILRQFNANKTLLSLLPHSNTYSDRKTIIMNICRSVNMQNINVFEDEITKVNQYEEYLMLKNTKLPSLRQEMELVQMQMQLLDGINGTISKLDENMNALNLKLGTLNEKKVALEHRKNIINTLTGLLPDLSSLLYQKEINEETLVDYDNSLSQMSSDIKFIREKEIEIATLQSRVDYIDRHMLKSAIDEIDKLKFDKLNLVQFMAERRLLEERYLEYKELREGLSPTKGVSLIYANLYLKNTRIIANKLLERVFDGKYRLDAFIIDESRFEIPCIGNGEINTDISTMSDGEKAIMGVILSFALMYQSSSRYNILRLDEVDGVLDTTNRAMFIAILEEMLEWFGIEQCFIISHNDAFEAYPLDIVMLRGAKIENLGQKNIIWDYNRAE